MRNPKILINHNRILWKGILVKRQSTARRFIDWLLGEPQKYRVFYLDNGQHKFPDGKPPDGDYMFYAAAKPVVCEVFGN